MPAIEVLLHREADGTVPLLAWMTCIPPKAGDKLRVRIRRLRDLGYELRRPEADYLRDGIHELRASLGGVQYRILYFFHGRSTAVLSHGLIKEALVPPREIDAAVDRRRSFRSNPGLRARMEETE